MRVIVRTKNNYHGVGFRELFIAIIFVGFSSFSFSHENISEAEIIEKFVDYINREYESLFSITSNDVLVDKKAIDNNESSDLMVYFDCRCGASLGCELDVYLCLSDSALCENDQYCYAGTFYEGDLANKINALTCKE